VVFSVGNPCQTVETESFGKLCEARQWGPRSGKRYVLKKSTLHGPIYLFLPSQNSASFCVLLCVMSYFTSQVKGVAKERAVHMLTPSLLSALASRDNSIALEEHDRGSVSSCDWDDGGQRNAIEAAYTERWLAEDLRRRVETALNREELDEYPSLLTWGRGSIMCSRLSTSPGKELTSSSSMSSMSPHDSPRRSLISRAVHKVRKKLPALYIDVPSSLMPSFARSKKTPVFRQQSPRFRPLPGDLWCGSARKEGGGHPEASHSADPHLVSACTDHAAHRVQAPPRSSWPPAQVQLRAAHAVVRSAAAHQQDFQELLESRPPVDMVPAAELKQLLDFGRSHDTKSRRHVDQCCAKKKGERVYT